MKLLKIGGSVITDKTGYRIANLENIDKAAEAIAMSWKRGIRDLVLVHGAGSFGHALVIKHKITEGVGNAVAAHLAAAETHAACSELSQIFVNALITHGAPAISVTPAVTITQKNKRIRSFSSAAVEFLGSGYLPVLYGDLVPDIELGASVCSGDQIISYLGKQADWIALGTNVDGVLDEKGQVIREVRSENLLDVSRQLKKVENDVTGGMEGKLKELLALKTTSYIFNATKPERIEYILAGKETICTRIVGR